MNLKPSLHDLICDPRLIVVVGAWLVAASPVIA